MVAASVGESDRVLDSDRVSVAARAYRPPEVEYIGLRYRICRPQKRPTRSRETFERTPVNRRSSAPTLTLKRGRSGSAALKNSVEDADELKEKLSEKGYTDLVLVTEKKVVASDDAILLSQQLKAPGKSQVRSLVRSTSDSAALPPSPVDPNLREVIVNGTSAAARYSSLKSVSFGSLNERSNPVKLNGKAYRGKIEVFVNAQGTLTVVNVVPLEEYLLGVVPSELGLPQLEAQKAQAVAARTYAVANIRRLRQAGIRHGADGLVAGLQGRFDRDKDGDRRPCDRLAASSRPTTASRSMAYYTRRRAADEPRIRENIFDYAEPYLRGVECSLEGNRHFEPFLIKTVRQPAKLRDEANLELARVASLLAVNGFSLTTLQITDDWFDETPSEGEMSNWLNQLAAKIWQDLSQCEQGDRKAGRAGSHSRVACLHAGSCRHAAERFGRQLSACVRRCGRDPEGAACGHRDAVARRLFLAPSRPDDQAEQAFFPGKVAAA